ncbi:HYC_CC_PP family protein [Gynurincola endophyticus]|uniref:HYC_CC_PP family protein n=1 Tax=Gynurincola endophyticus TaxID=2479004 RepID=UPI000F8EB05C|nr:hypothetical protein [Gynurincola endophyticus]
MKRFAVVILSLFYLLVTSGFIVNVHYCMGRLASVEIGASSTDVCGFCGMEEDKNGCCHTDEQHYKVEDVHQNVAANFVFSQPVTDDVIELPFYQEYLTPLLTQRVILYNKYHAPPDRQFNQVYLYNCNFRI